MRPNKMSCDVDTQCHRCWPMVKRKSGEKIHCLLDATPTNHSSSSRELLIYMSVHPRIHVSHPIKKQRERRRGNNGREKKEGEKNRVRLSPLNVAVVRGIVWLWVVRWSLPWKTIHERTLGVLETCSRWAWPASETRSSEPSSAGLAS
jgi:hypothetical protein